MTTQNIPNRRRFVLSWTWRTVVWAALAALVLVLAAAVMVPRVAGATPYTVLTGSMRPEYPPGTLVVVRQVDADEIAVGDVITYQLQSGRSAVVTHRVVAAGVSMSGSGERTFRTQGDANGALDEAPVRPVQVRGRVWYSVPYLGHVNTWLTGRERQLITYGVAGSLIVYAGWMFGTGRTDRRRRGDHAA